VPDKVFVDKGVLYCAMAEKDEMADVVFTILYKSNENDALYIKRCKIEKFILDKSYDLIPENAKLIYLTTKEAGRIYLMYAPAPRQKISEESFNITKYLIKGLKAGGVKLTTREVKSCKFISEKRKQK
ncbi:MAG: DNA topoisomerase IV subunit A, partial [Spirochaetaceae bacterium]|nr:DNA topoisomerase IV subunit A [Spirochaetaceae bacterium]